MFRRSFFILANTIKTSTPAERVGVIHLSRPNALNALNSELVRELGGAIECFDGDKNIGCIVITGEGKAFAAGADIKEMAPMTFSDVYNNDLFGDLVKVRRAKTPIIAAVNGFALGGGCELAMMCDIIYASEKAKFGQPEIKLGTIPGIGGTQNLTKLIGKSRAMEWVLTGKQYSAQEAKEAGLVAQVYPAEELMPKVLETAKLIASYSNVTTQLAKVAVNEALELGISEGLHFEKRVFQSTFGTEDRKEGMEAFAAKRAPSWKHA